MITSNIGELCKRRGITFAELEKSVGLGNGTIRKWESHSPSVYTVLKVADYFHVTLDEIVRAGKESA